MGLAVPGDIEAVMPDVSAEHGARVDFMAGATDAFHLWDGGRSPARSIIAHVEGEGLDFGQSHLVGYTEGDEEEHQE